MKVVNKKIVIQIVLIILLFFVLRMWQQQDLVQGTAPSFSSRTLSGETLSSRPLSNQPILIHFWATWCLICSVENDSIQAIAKDYRVLNIAMQSGSDADIKQYAKTNKLKLNNIINDNTASLARLFGVRGTPSSFIVNPQGKIEFTEVGYTTELGLRFRLWWAGL